MQMPDFIKEVVWSVYPPRYRQLADKPFRKSLGYISRILLIAFLLAGLVFVPKLFLLKDNIESELSKFETFKISGDVKQTDRVSIPKTNPWVVVDLNSNVTLAKELFVVDSKTVQYRFLNIKSIPREQLTNVAEYKAPASRFFTSVLLLMLPGIALILYIRMWLKYFLLVFVAGIVFFIIMELSKFRLKWVQMMNIAAHALTIVILIEVVSAPFTTVYLLPVLRFLGVNIYAITTALFAILMVAGIAGYHIGDYRRK
jgi:hypothetical protein